MKTKIKMAAFIPVAAFIVMNACTKEDETPKPEVNLTELGYENSKAGYAGSDLHIDADIVAEGRIERVAIEIHPEGGYDKSAALITIILHISCGKDNEIDKQKPEIDLSIPGAFPKNCDTLYFGEPFIFKALFSDNVELGSYSIDIHHNFDHHSHSTEVTACVRDPKKVPVNPFVYIMDFSIAPGLRELETNREITIPAGNSTGLYEEGDYHFFISLTDKDGWSTQKGLSIKMFHR